MKMPAIELTPLRPATRSDAPTTLDVLLKIMPPLPEVQVQRPPLNLGLVLDRSGSMSSARKLDYAREAAIFAVQQLLPTDRVSIVIFDDKVQTLVTNTLAEDKNRLVSAIQGILPGGSTALHGGWREGAKQVGGHPIPGGMNRVLLLSDGLANVGESNPDAIATDVHRMSKEGVSTTTLGLGDDYNEDLLEAMANSGDGNYYYVENSNQLPAIFQSELQGLMATIGNAVTLQVETASGVTVADVLNDLDKTPDGKLKLPNLVAGMPLLLVIRLNVPPMSQSQTADICRFRLEWNAPKSAERAVLAAPLSVPAVSSAIWDSLAENVEVQEQAALMLIARYKKQATQSLERGDIEAAKRLLADAKKILVAAPQTPEIKREFDAFSQIEAHIESGEHMKFQKHAKHQVYQRRSSKPYFS
ncbi:MAG: VWA domain-containing protein [Gemmataceae bacterium]